MTRVSIVNSQIIFISKDKILSPIRWREEILETYKCLSCLRTVKLEEISKTITDGVHVTPNYSKRGYKFLSSQCINTPFIDEKQVRIVSAGWYLKYKKEFSQKDDILISKSGRIGTVALVVENDKYAFYEGVALIRLQKGEIRSHYAVIFLASKFGQHQIKSKIKGISQPHLHLEEIREIKIPILPKDFQLHIEQLVKQAYEKRKLAEQKYQQAEELLYELLGISKEEIEKLEAEKAYETNFKEVKKALRFDAEYYHPKYLGVLNLLRQTPFELKPLKEIAKIKHKKVNPEEEPYRTNKIKYIEIGGIDTAFGEIIEYTEEYGWKLPSGGKYIVKEKDMLYSKVRPYRKGIGFVTKEFEGSLVTQGFTVIRCKSESIIPEYLFLYLRSDVGNLPLLRNMSGSTYPTVKDEDIGEILVPIIPKDKQQEIANLVRECFKLRKEARQLIQKAIKEVEEAIENASRSNRE